VQLAISAPEALDQRGVTRPGGAACDIGAYEGSVPADLEMRTTTFTAKNAHILPGYKMCDQSQPACTGGVDPQADSAQSYAIDAFNYFLSRYGRNGADDNALPVIATVHYQTDYDNSFWNGEQMVFGDSHGWARADDVVAHEFSHGITENTSKLFYYYQSGAINESLSDMWGEFVDQTNAKGTDNGTVRWQIGEDISGLGAIRNMQNPPAFGQPDSTKSRYYYQGWQDNGGVHVNSGVNNKAVYLLTDGGTFNKRTVSALGITKVSDIYYEVETHLLTSASDYANLYYALYQGCLNLRGGSAGITQADCQQVQNAIDAVRMNFAPEASYNPEAIACPKGQATGPALMIFNDDMEHGLGNWTTPFYSEWVYSTGFATSGERMWWGRDDFNNNESSLQMSSVIALPAKVASYLYFNHAYDFEYGGYYSPATKKYYDGGVLEYSLDGGAWKDAGPLFGSGKKYDGKLSANYQNPLGGRKAYSGISHGYVSSRYNLSSLAGHTVSFRWRIGTDEMNSVLGWFLDDVQIYTCQGAPSKPSLTAPANKALVASYTPMLDWKDLTVNFHHYQVQVATSSAFSTLVIDQNNLPVSNFTPTTPLAPNTIFYWRVRAFNAVGVAGAWSKVYSFHTPMPASIQLNTDNGPGLR
jgi:bacillolysin